MVTAITDIMATTTTLAAVEGHAVRVGPFRAASVSHISMVRGTFMEGRTKTGDIDNICGGRFGGLLFCSGNLAIFAAIRRASSFVSSLWRPILSAYPARFCYYCPGRRPIWE